MIEVLWEISSKLIAMEWANIWVQLSKRKKTREWCTALYYGAKKEFRF